MGTNEHFPVRVGGELLPNLMTERQALRYGLRHMPADLARAGFECVIYRATPEVNGWSGFRVNYGMRCGVRS